MDSLTGNVYNENRSNFQSHLVFDKTFKLFVRQGSWKERRNTFRILRKSRIRVQNCEAGLDCGQSRVQV